MSRPRKYPLIIDGLAIPEKDMRHVHRKASKGYVYWTYRLNNTALDTSNVQAFYKSLEIAKEITSNKGDFIMMCGLYQKSRSWKSLSASSKRTYNISIKQLIEIFEPTTQNDWNNRKIRQYVNAFRDQGADKPKMTNLKLNVLKNIIYTAYDNGIIEFNHIKDVDALPVNMTPRKNIVWSDEVIDQVMTYPDAKFDQLKFTIALCLYTAQRIGDVVSMKWADIENDHIKVIQKKTKSNVFIPINDDLRNLLSHIPRIGITIISQKNGQPYASEGISSQWSRLKKILGIENLRIHDCRGTAISKLLIKNDKSKVALISGHKSLASMAAYFNNTNDHSADVAMSNVYPINFKKGE